MLFMSFWDHEIQTKILNVCVYVCVCLFTALLPRIAQNQSFLWISEEEKEKAKGLVCDIVEHNLQEINQVWGTSSLSRHSCVKGGILENTKKAIKGKADISLPLEVSSATFFDGLWLE